MSNKDYGLQQTFKNYIEIYKAELLKEAMNKIYENQTKNEYTQTTTTSTQTITINYNGNYNWSFSTREDRYFEDEARKNPEYGPILNFLEDAFKSGITKVYLSDNDKKVLQYSPHRSSYLIIKPFGVGGSLIGRYKGIVNIYVDGEEQDV